MKTFYLSIHIIGLQQFRPDMGLKLLFKFCKVRDFRRLVFIVFLLLTIGYFWLERGASTTILWSLSFPFLFSSTCRGGRVVGGWYREWRSDRMISSFKLFLVGIETNWLSSPNESRMLVMFRWLKSPPKIKLTSLLYLDLNK